MVFFVEMVSHFSKFCDFNLIINYIIASTPVSEFFILELVVFCKIEKYLLRSKVVKKNSFFTYRRTTPWPTIYQTTMKWCLNLI